MALRPLIEQRVARLGGVTVGILIAGSRVDPRVFQHAGEPLGAQVKLVGIRVGGSGGGRSVTVAGGLTLLSVSRLEELPKVLKALG
jgi:hypothetical protein